MVMFTLDKKRYKAGQVVKIYSIWSMISPVPIWHYGVVVGFDDVVHFNLDADTFDIRIIRTDLERFVGNGRNLQVCQMSELHKVYDKDEIVCRALRCVGTDFGGYNLLNNNCEHFANWCVCGQKFSNQVPAGEGVHHSLTDKIIDRAAEPVFKALDDIEYAGERFFEKMDPIVDWLDNIFG